MYIIGRCGGEEAGAFVSPTSAVIGWFRCFSANNSESFHYIEFGVVIA